MASFLRTFSVTTRMVSRGYASSCVLRHHKNGFTCVCFFLRSPSPQEWFHVGTLLLAFSSTATMLSSWYASSCVLRHRNNAVKLVRFFLRSPPPQQCCQVGTLLLAFSSTATMLSSWYASSCVLRHRNNPFRFGNWYASWGLRYHNTALSHLNSKLLCCLCRYRLKVEWVGENCTVMVPTYLSQAPHVGRL